MSKEEFKNWHLKDIEKDNLLGISLERAYTELLKKSKPNSVIVAVLDSEINIKHDYLKQQIWVNKNEIPDNGIDDDNNGYIDDINGWNYIGTKENDSAVFSSFAYTRVIKKYDFKFKNTTKENIPLSEEKEYNIYKRAQNAFNKELKYRKSNIAQYDRIQKKYNEASEVLSQYFTENKYNQKQLDSLHNAITDENLRKQISRMKYYLKHGVNNRTIYGQKNTDQKIINRNLNINHNGKYHVKDDANDINDFPYGNNNVEGLAIYSHGTKISSVIASKRDNNNNDVIGIIDSVKIMCLNTSTAGDEYDKDIALAIRYAVDNGAKVINMSFSKAFSLHPEWVKEAIIYAEKKDVLIVTSAGNSSLDLDNDYDYPNDRLDDGLEYANNFLKVGATTYNLDSTLVARFSNYGKTEVDIFAPGNRINCLQWSKPTIDSGTSISSAVVSGVGALIFSYYPNLTAAQVKTIIMESGFSLDLMVNKPSYDKEKETVPFNTLSKSGKIVNVYNALIMAEEVSKRN